MPIDMEAIRKMARESEEPTSARELKRRAADPRDVLSPWEREHLAPGSARITIPIRDSVEVKGFMILLRRMAERVIVACDAANNGQISERTAQISAASEIRSLNRQMNRNPTIRNPAPTSSMG